MSALEKNIRIVKKSRTENAPCANIPPDAIRVYLISRRRALLTELDELNRMLGFPKLVPADK